ncbi:MAG TPA: anhydro-N-acetylmuramic acid kinase [Thermotogota bacterium]|nr:anhydro-N-acetylmuramic acid kinase [Thermotogota bacterium]HRW92237.1 anhydro-N-acetylmuramic acid kinase [Thermotogota bacterium]
MKTILGCMSGTSCDGLNICACSFEGHFTATSFRLLAFESIPFSPGLREHILTLTTGKIDVATLAHAHAFLGELFGEMIHDFVDRHAVSNVDLVVSHGQTVFHDPSPGKLPAGRPPWEQVPCTLQIGDGDFISVKTGLPVLSDVRMKDVALGGQGAPLAVFGDFVLFSQQKANVALLNLGGIANVTYLPAGASLEQVKAFDTGPANTLVDWACQTYFSQPFDRDGSLSRGGKVHAPLLEKLLELENDYGQLPPPKSTGKEIRYNELYHARLAQAIEALHVPAADAVRTLVECTTATVEMALRRFLQLPDQLIVTGGGAYNPTMLGSLRERLAGCEVSLPPEPLPQAKEAILFAILGNEYVNGHFSNVPSATGARKAARLGKLSLPD